MLGASPYAPIRPRPTPCILRAAFQSPRCLLPILICLGVTLFATAVRADSAADSTANRPQLALQTGHTAEVISVQVSPDGRQMITGSHDRTARLWDLSTGRLLRTFSGQKEWILNAAFWPQPGTVATANRDATVCLWDPVSGALQKTITGPQPAPLAVAFSPGGKRVASSGGDRSVVLWDPATSAVQQKWSDLPAKIDALAFSPDGKRLAGGARNGHVIIWSTADGLVERRLPAHAMQVHAVAFSPAGDMLAVGCQDGQASIWNSETGALEQRIRVNNIDEPVTSLAFSPNGALLATGSHRGEDTTLTLQLWNVRTGNLFKGLRNPAMAIDAVAFAPDGRTIIAGARDSTLTIWDFRTAMIQRTIGHTAPIKSIAISPDGKRLVCAGGNAAVRLWDMTTGEFSRRFTGDATILNSVAFSPNGALIAAGHRSGKVDLWDAADGTLKQTLPAGKDPVNSVAFSPDGKLVACGLGDWDPGTVQIWNLTTGKVVQSLDAGGGMVNAVAFSPDGSLIAAGCGNWSGGEIRLWDVATGQSRMREYTHAVHAVAFSPDGKLLASGTTMLNDNGEAVGDEVKIWNAHTAEIQRTLDEPAENGWTDSLAFSPDGKILAIGSRSSAIALWNPWTGERLGDLQGHVGNVFSVAFSPHSGLLVSGSGDETIRLWDAAARRPVATLLALRSPLQGDIDPAWLAILPQGYYTGSPGAGRYIQWRVGGDLFPVSAFERQLRRPDLVRAGLAGQAVTETAQAREFNAGAAIPPEVAITSPAPGDRLTGPTTEVRFTVTGAGEVPNVTVLVNGRADNAKVLTIGRKTLTIGRKMLLIGRKEIPAAHNAAADLTAEVTLPPGESSITITVIATDPQGLEARDQVSVTGGNSAGAAGDLYVLAIGVTHYANPNFNLKYAASDAAAFAGLWPADAVFHAVHPTVLTDAQATAPAIRAALAGFKDAKPGDTVALFLSGHGLQTDDGNFYFATYEVDPSSQDHVKATALPWQDLEDGLRALPVHRAMLFLDACHSGAALGGQEPHSEQLAETLARQAGVLVFASSRGSEYSYELDAEKHGAFTAALIQGIKDGKADFDVGGQRTGVITAEELLTYLQLRVPQLTGNQQTPTCPLLVDFGGAFALAKAPALTASASEGN